ncbi:MAG: hypothetical protein KKC19_01045 [Nanoarchaeota archaeon]|nr:hypothetical protein [Nanoarchaeota archaeon]
MAKKVLKKLKVEIKKPRRIKKVAKKFSETSRTAIIAAFGFLIALAWRDAISSYVEKITVLSPVQGNLVVAVLITLVGVIGIILVTPKEPEEK